MITIAAICAAAAVFVTVYTLVTSGRPAAVSARLNQYDRGESIADRDARLAQPFAARVLNPTAGRARGLVMGLLPTSMLARFERWLILAGDPISLHAFVAVEIAAIATAVVLLFVMLASGSMAGASAIGVLLAVAAIAVAPLYWLRIRIGARKKAILKALPDAVDLIVTTVEAGMSIDGALSEVGQEIHGPLGDELRLAVRETTLGRSRRDALERLVMRTDVRELREFIHALIQAEQTGIPVGQVLRTQAAQLRIRRRQQAESEAQKAPVKMAVVLVLLTLPTLMLVLLGPTLINISEDSIL